MRTKQLFKSKPRLNAHVLWRFFIKLNGIKWIIMFTLLLSFHNYWGNWFLIRCKRWDSWVVRLRNLRCVLAYPSEISLIIHCPHVFGKTGYQENYIQIPEERWVSALKNENNSCIKIAHDNNKIQRLLCTITTTKEAAKEVNSFQILNVQNWALCPFQRYHYIFGSGMNLLLKMFKHRYCFHNQLKLYRTDFVDFTLQLQHLIWFNQINSNNCIIDFKDNFSWKFAA